MIPSSPDRLGEDRAPRARWTARAAIPALALLFALGTYGALHLIFRQPAPRPRAAACPAFSAPAAGAARAPAEDWQRLIVVQELGGRDPRRALVELQQDQARFAASPLGEERDALAIHLQICLRGAPAVRPAAEEFLARTSQGPLADQIRRELGPP